jgi:hypothetical protein
MPAVTVATEGIMRALVFRKTQTADLSHHLIQTDLVLTNLVKTTINNVRIIVITTKVAGINNDHPTIATITVAEDIHVPTIVTIMVGDHVPIIVITIVTTEEDNDHPTIAKIIADILTALRTTTERIMIKVAHTTVKETHNNSDRTIMKVVVVDTIVQTTIIEKAEINNADLTTVRVEMITNAIRTIEMEDNNDRIKIARTIITVAVADIPTLTKMGITKEGRTISPRLILMNQSA